MQQQLFDYRTLEPDDRAFAKERAVMIRDTAKRTAQGIINIGQWLSEAKARLQHGRWLQWLKGEFGWTARTARLLPLMSETDLTELADDIKEHGQREPIYTVQGKIIDGRNRYLACERIGVKPKFEEWTGKGSLTAFVVSENVKRRHLSSTQRACVGEASETMFAKEAKERQRLSKGRGKKGTEKIPDLKRGESRDKAAKAAGTNAHYISDVKAIKKTAPEIVPLMLDGKLSMEESKQAAKLPPADVEVIVKHMEAGATLQQAAAKLPKPKDPRPTPAKARKLAIATGKYMLANNDMYIPPVTTEVQERNEDEMVLIGEFIDSVNVISQMTHSPFDIWRMADNWLPEVLDAPLSGAISILYGLRNARKEKAS